MSDEININDVIVTPEILKKIICPVCGRYFEPVTWNNIYCNPDCSKNKFLKERNKKWRP